MCFFSDVVTVVTFELTDARPRAMKALGMRGKHAKKNPTRTRADPVPHQKMHILRVLASSKIVFDFWPSSLSFETEQALSSVVSAC